ncbi:MAG: ribulose-phosphate 3-epimerase [Pirellulaceae bacterium]
MSRRQRFVRLREAVPAVLPSLLLCDFGNLEREVARLEETQVGGLHLDVMDGQFAPNLTYGMPIVAALRRLTQLPLDVHLMIAEPRRYARAFCEAGADVITFHAEAVDDPRPVLKEIREQGVAAGIAFNPDTPMSCLASCADLCDLVLVMSVQAGFGGQAFRTVALDRLGEVRGTVGPDVLLEVDGGINRETLGDCAAAGAQLFVAGSAIFRAPSYDSAVRELIDLAAC